MSLDSGISNLGRPRCVRRDTAVLLLGAMPRDRDAKMEETMTTRFSRRGLIGTSAAFGMSLPLSGSGFAAPVAFAQDVTPAAGTINTGTLETRIGSARVRQRLPHE